MTPLLLLPQLPSCQLLLLLWSSVGEAPYLTNWYNPYPHSTTLHMSLWQRFVTSFVVPAGSFAAMHKPLKQLAKLKQQCGVQAPQGPPSTRYAHALKMINTFTGFEVRHSVWSHRHGVLASVCQASMLCAMCLARTDMCGTNGCNLAWITLSARTGKTKTYHGCNQSCPWQGQVPFVLPRYHAYCPCTNRAACVGLVLPVYHSYCPCTARGAYVPLVLRMYCS